MKLISPQSLELKTFLTKFVVSSSKLPITILSGFIKSSNAFPSRKNSGLETTKRSLRCVAAAMVELVPTGTVDLLTMMLPGASNSRMSFTTDKTASISTRPSVLCGVGRQRKQTRSLGLRLWIPTQTEDAGRISQSQPSRVTLIHG